MPGEQAYRMSDFYIHKVDEATTIDLVEELHDAACMDYAKRMQQIKNKPVCSKPVTLCLNYIYAHMHEKITTEDLAEEVHLHPSYLSRLFREQMGCTLHDYILDQKIQTAKQMRDGCLRARRGAGRPDRPVCRALESAPDLPPDEGGDAACHL